MIFYSFGQILPMSTRFKRPILSYLHWCSRFSHINEISRRSLALTQCWNLLQRKTCLIIKHIAIPASDGPYSTLDVPMFKDSPSNSLDCISKIHMISLIWDQKHWVCYSSRPNRPYLFTYYPRPWRTGSRNTGFSTFSLLQHWSIKLIFGAVACRINCTKRITNDEMCLCQIIRNGFDLN